MGRLIMGVVVQKGQCELRTGFLPRATVCEKWVSQHSTGTEIVMFIDGGEKIIV